MIMKRIQGTRKRPEERGRCRKMKIKQLGVKGLQIQGKGLAVF